MKYDPLIRSDSCAASSPELEVRNAYPFICMDSSVRKPGCSRPPFSRVMTPEAQASRIPIPTSAEMPRMASLSSR